MLSPKDTRELLYRMLRGGFLALQVWGQAGAVDVPQVAVGEGFPMLCDYQGRSGRMQGGGGNAGG